MQETWSEVFQYALETARAINVNRSESHSVLVYLYLYYSEPFLSFPKHEKYRHILLTVSHQNNKICSLAAYTLKRRKNKAEREEGKREGESENGNSFIRSKLVQICYDLNAASNQ